MLAPSPNAAPLPANDIPAEQAAVPPSPAEQPSLPVGRWQPLLEQLPLGLLVLNADFTLCYANVVAIALLGLPVDTRLVGRSVLDFSHPDYHADWARLQHEVHALHRSRAAVETCLLRASGTVLWCRVTVLVVVSDGQPVVFATLEDISGRRHLEAQVLDSTHELESANEELTVFNEELQASNEELLALNREFDTFVYAASRELRQPVASLRSLLQALEEQLLAPTRPGPLVEPLLGRMQETLTRVDHTLDRLADFNAVQLPGRPAGEMVVLGAVLEQVRRELEPVLVAGGGQLEVDLAGNPSLWFSRPHLHSVLLHLLSNALHHRHPDWPSRVRVCSYRQAGRLIVRVQDNGMGLHPAEQEALLQPFARAHPPVAGTGVGLYLVKKILDQAGGSLQVESQPGAGSTYTAVFPA
ncbi:PAS domain-containing sensor histidine kinase [Hymenobacter sp. YC55]|uniref:sensor histidine kinase n=1 Tax=Hymenobacter sp. YC55 TaxID=3034019 RepID=UPI0023F782AA|nr:PAS domain-containing sensor histidine kinase [Hymenobacter sp. YC55]MDF7815709.1 PAS domain-containing sensor histidine kinase [Hymenobacter sp. YC55]